MAFPKGNKFGTANKGNKRPDASEFWKKWNAEKHPTTEAQRAVRRISIKAAIAARLSKCAHILSEINPELKIGSCKKCGAVPLKTTNHNSASRQGIQYICWVGSLSPRGASARVTYPNQALDLWNQQCGKCAICGRTLVRGGGLADESGTLDHCHTTGVIRAWLCQPCNKGLGHFHEDPDLMRLATRYVEEKCKFEKELHG